MFGIILHSYKLYAKYIVGVKQDGSVSHFFHRAIKAYNTGTRKRRKITDDDFGDVRWHKTGRTKPVVIDGVQKGCKKIMVLYMSFAKGGRAEKTNWVMHQYHLGTEEDERDGEYVISKIFHQQQNVKQGEVTEQEAPEIIDTIKVDPHTPNSATPEPPRIESRCVDVDPEQDSIITSTSVLVEVYENGISFYMFHKSRLSNHACDIHMNRTNLDLYGLCFHCVQVLNLKCKIELLFSI